MLAIAIAMLTLAGTSVAAAETTEWQEYSRESWRVLTVPTAAEWTGKITFVEEPKVGTFSEYECSETISGTVGPKAAAEFQKWTFSKCTYHSNWGGECSESQSKSMEPHALPWQTGLETSSSKFYNAIPSNKEFSVLCSGHRTSAYICEDLPGELLVNKEKAVEYSFEPKAAQKMKCYNEGHDYLESKGEIKLTSGNKLRVV
ncbi:MAG TPA: hypothetical protein VGL57_04565 [Solirubrobacteraceae bacterium]